MSGDVHVRFCEHLRGRFPWVTRLITGFRRDYLQQRTNLREFMCRSVLATQFILTDRYTSYLLPPCVQDYLPEDHMARFVVELVDQLDLRSLSMQP